MRQIIVYGLFCLCVLLFALQACQSRQEVTEQRYYSNGLALYKQRCSNCHGPQGEGFRDLYPALKGSEKIRTRDGLACLIRFGSTPEALSGRQAMPANRDLAPIDIAYLIHYISNSFGNQQEFYDTRQVQEDLKHCE